MRYMVRSVQLIFITLCLVGHGISYSDDSSPLQFGVFPFFPPAQLEDLFVPVAIDLSRTIGRPVQFRTRPSFAEFDEETVQQTYDLIYMQPFAYARLGRQGGYETVARRATPLSAIFVTTEDSFIKKISDLRGKILATPPASAAVTLLGFQLLVESQLQPGGDVTLDDRNSHFSCLRRIMIGKADACVTTSQPLAIFQKKSGAQLRIIAESEAIPATTFAIHRRVAPALRDKLTKRILGWKQSDEGKRILEKLHHTHYIPSRDSDYDLVREILAEIKKAPAGVQEERSW